jgi:hypothetical protein
VWPPRASEAAVAELARRFDLDTTTTSPATLEQLDWAIEHFGQAYLTTPPSELVEEVMRYERWVRALLAGNRTPGEPVVRPGGPCRRAGILRRCAGHGGGERTPTAPGLGAEH